MSFSNQSYASPGNNLWVSNQSAKRIQFEELSNPPLAQLDKHVLYVLNDDKLYYDGQEVAIGTGAGGDVSSNTKPSRDLSISVYDGITGEQIKQSVLSISEPGTGIMEISQWIEGDLFSYRLLYSAFDEAITTLGLFAGNSNIATNGTLNTTIIGTGAARTNVAFNGCVFVGNSAGRTATGTNDLTIIGHLAGFANQASSITAIGKNALYGSGIAYSTAIGVDSQKESIDTSSGPNTSIGAYSMKNLQKASGNNAVGWRALEGASAGMINGPRLNNSMGNYNGLSATDGFENNVMIGNSVLNSVATGIGNVVVGNSAGEGNISGSNYNIYLGNGAGISGSESRVIRIGASGDNTVYPYAIAKPTDCYIQGIHNRSPTIATEHKLMAVDSSGKIYGCDLGQANPHCWGYFQDYVSLYVVPIVSTNVFVPVAPNLIFTTPGGNYFTNSSPGIITYQGIDLVNAFVTVQMSARLTGGSNENFDFAIYKNGFIVSGSTLRRRITNAAEYGCCTLSLIVPNITSGSTIQVWCANATGTQVLAIGNFNITVQAKF